MKVRIGGLWAAMSLLALTQASLAGVGSEHNYAKIQKFLREVHAQRPQETELFVLGISGTGDPIEGIKIGSGRVHNLIVATHHGNEYGSSEVAVGAILDLAARPIPGRTVYVIPVLNISGFNHNRREESLHGDGRPTADANRNYPGPCGTEGPFTLSSTRALADFIDRENIVTSATLHTFHPAVLYPWGLASQDLSTPYDDLFIGLGKIATEVSGYQVGNSTQILYPANGTFEDYAYWKHGIWSLLFELGNSHSPGSNDVDEMVRVNVPGLRKLMENAPIARALDHEFRGRCDDSLLALDRHDE